MSSPRFLRSAARAALVLPFFLSTSCADKKSEAPSPSDDAPVVDLSQSDLFTPAATPRPQLAPTAVVVSVNGTDITQAEIDKETQGVIANLSGRVPPERIAQLRQQIDAQAVDSIVTRTLLEQEVAKAKVEISEAELDEAIQRITTNMPPGVTLNDFLERRNITEVEFREQFTRDLRINKLLEAKTEAVAEPTAEEVTAYYEENKAEFSRPESVTASHILIATEPMDSDEQKAEKKAKAEEIRKKLLDGADFAATASESSDCPSKAQGGSLGTFGRGQMVKPFEDAAFSQPTNAIGDIVETQFGYHIIRVEEHSTAGEVPLEEVRERLGKYLYNQRRQVAAQEFLSEVRKSADVKYAEGYEPPPAAMPGL